MPLSEALRRHATYPRRIAWSSAMAGGLFFLLFAALSLHQTWQKRERQHQQLLENSRTALQQTLSSLINSTLSPLLPFTHTACNTINRELTSRAAFAGNLRAILLVKEGNAFCSSATGSFNLPLNVIAPLSDISRDIDLQLMPGTPLQPNKPALALWIKNPGSLQSGVFATLNITLAPYQLLASGHPEITGMALVAQRSALTSWQSVVMQNKNLPTPLHRQALTGYPLQFVLYGSTLAFSDYQNILLSGLLLSLLVSGACWLLLSVYQRPGKELIRGMKRGEFHVEYQPLVTSHDGQPYGMEALLRWTHPTKGPIPPDVFIHYAEAQNLIIPLTRHLFQLVSRDAHLLCHTIPRHACLSLNISPLHLADSGFRQDVLRWLDTMPADHFTYVFEITERAMVRDENVGELFDWLHQQQIHIAIDDFGTGHSALIYLERYDFDYLKIDRGFVQSIGTDSLTSPVLDTVLQLAKKLNLKSVAEGVETGEQAAWLINRGVTHLQGYIFSRPLRPETLIDYFRRHNA
ncbi:MULTISPECIES: cyclic di-GMP phosphodiesterase [Pantoea]|jgi:EAL domain-containing protein (putative c-di-GMP-specific phosphodiesterase class I)|uniref:cyclic di-GMP phosphodiesterase n=1 Tax=Pantoea TaxID=53335 RepID=UPI0003B1ED25|nr:MULTISPECIES: cyclic di-GMP phosphodiesterase [Pantoea]ERM08902.1 phage resistance protein [Pantoea agglomerans Tx10]MBD8196621.1 cyclic di-GMP phosphodiesterase [Pantoea agglomerans]MBD8261049.1 cyclic di-GMP phosphodiesterase [Pantoea agglomerans]MDF2914665.1 phage resistance protein [Pantoea agglomerans]WRO91389.1 cyclic di-GMP phosphodiesterase [Pantoea agglomerans]